MSEANGGVEQRETSKEKSCRRPTNNRFGKQALMERNGQRGRAAVLSGDNATLGIIGKGHLAGRDNEKRRTRMDPALSLSGEPGYFSEMNRTTIFPQKKR